MFGYNDCSNKLEHTIKQNASLGVLGTREGILGQ